MGNCKPPCQMLQVNVSKLQLHEWEIVDGGLLPSHPIDNLTGVQMLLAQTSKAKFIYKLRTWE